MKLVTWNVNSLAARMPRVLEFLEMHQPDVACLQETKCGADAFPAQELARAGYAAVVPRLAHCDIVRDFRKGSKPSDHAPLLVELRD
jgi:exonuclease III